MERKLVDNPPYNAKLYKEAHESVDEDKPEDESTEDKDKA